jgi:hypothetical protein
MQAFTADFEYLQAIGGGVERIKIAAVIRKRQGPNRLSLEVGEPIRWRGQMRPML